MILAALIAAAAPASPGPVVPYAEARSIAYRDCVAAEQGRRPAPPPVARIGRSACARTRSRLLSAVHDHVGYGWLATAKTAGQAKRMRAQLKRSAAEALGRFEGEVQAWLATAPHSSPAEAGVQISGRAGSRPSPGNN
jgi:hypothetical protein